MSKLGAKATTGATALALFHRYNEAVGSNATDYDPYLIACSCIYLSGKADNDHQKLRDLINVSQTTLKKISEPLNLNEEYYAIREAIVQAELFLLRMINFKVQVEHPHKYLLHYLKSLKEWFSPDVWQRYPVAETSWSILQDFYHDPNVISSDKAIISLACIKLALQSFGIAVPYSKIEKPWHSVFHPKATDEMVWEVMAKIMENYTQDLSHVQPLVIRT